MEHLKREPSTIPVYAIGRELVQVFWGANGMPEIEEHVITYSDGSQRRETVPWQT